MTDLHSALRAVIEQRLEVARAADLTGLDSWYSVSDLTKGHRDGGAGLNDVDAGYIALHDPADAIRRYERDLKVLERHRKVSTRHSAPGQAWCCGCYGEAPCPDLSDLFDVYPEVTK